ncbi:SMI1 / KNR4 family (SUKH-1) [Treponema bryantii]|uniref:SMI1 / KNR4 family (SUKH-1) n=1 Tax=Treponema bryantii TaxID=163 RepID=A0A1I3LNQ5_9SPIR|nr:SMI1/KNR4 family protein [Treponema bryantii]SFI86170.1 SMI1 / KNR4 family (SUKH-1) [Treponema bryantii]
MNWNYVKPTTVEKISHVEKMIDAHLPENLKTIVLLNNNGRPEKDCFDTEINQGVQFKQLLSFNEDDVETIYAYIDFIKKEKIFPFADDPSGNLICLDKEKIILWNHETNEKEFIADSLEDFINSLYE